VAHSDLSRLDDGRLWHVVTGTIKLAFTADPSFCARCEKWMARHDRQIVST